MAYAERTSVPVSRTRDEIERTLARYGATAFGYIASPNFSAVEFTTSARRVRLVLPMPDDRLKQTAYDAEVRRRWRVLLLTIKAKLESIDSGVSTFDQEFLANLVLPTGESVGEWLAPQLNGRVAMPELLPGPAR